MWEAMEAGLSQQQARVNGVLTLGSLWRSSREGNEEVLLERNFGYLEILVPVKQTRICGSLVVNFLWNR